MSGVESRACERSFITGEVVVLGGFSKIPPSTQPGWIILVKSVNKTVWVVAVSVDEAQHRYRVGLLDRIPWEHWIGDRADGTIYRGDIPRLAVTARDRAKRSTTDE